MINVLDFSSQKEAQVNEKLQRERDIVVTGEAKVSEEQTRYEKACIIAKHYKIDTSKVKNYV